MAALFTAVALMNIAMTCAGTASTLIAAELGGEGASGLPNASAVLGTALGALGIGTLMARYGRRTALIRTYLIGTAGTLTSFLGAATHFLEPLMLGQFLLGLANGGALLSRYVAAELYPASHKGTALSAIVWSGTVGAIVGPAIIAPAATTAGNHGLTSLAGPIAVAAVATAVFVHLQRQATRQRALIGDLVRTRRELAATERRAGVLAERQRLSTEIHDTLAQGLSSQQMLLQAAERVWETDPDTAAAHIRKAAGITSRSLAEARRFVHDLAPADLAQLSLPAALSALAERESGPGLTVEFRLDGDPHRLPERVEAALLRIAQGALANVREHAAATRAALTLTCLDDQISLDVADNGRGFDATASPTAPDRSRGHGLPAMCIRARQSGGTLTVESTPGEGTVVSAAIPLAVKEAV
jgi:signal transduction histidine kinase